MAGFATVGQRDGTKVTKRVPRHHATTDVTFDGEEAEFLKEMDSFKARTGKKFPTLTDCLNVLRGLGWEKRRSWEDEPVEVVLAG